MEKIYIHRTSRMKYRVQRKNSEGVVLEPLAEPKHHREELRFNVKWKEIHDDYEAAETDDFEVEKPINEGWA